MTPAILITFCTLLLTAYVFNLTAAKTKIPSVILLILLGWGIKQGTSLINIDLPDFSLILPVLATIGLILIVLEGAMELNVNKSKIGLIKKTLLGAVFPILCLATILAFVFSEVGDIPYQTALINAIPLCIISSAIAIPSVINLSPLNKEFIIYESSLSDITGVLLFNFVAHNDEIGVVSFGSFGLQLVAMVIISIVSTAGLSILLNKIDHHVKFVPLILLVILIYAISKVFHLPALIFILLFGLSIGNLNLFNSYKWFKPFRNDDFKEEIEKFKEITIEGAFLLRALFFILFGFTLKTIDIIDLSNLPWSLGIVATIVALRFIQLKLSNVAINPLLFVSPRGLITILLFFGITPEDAIPYVNKSLIIQVIILTALVMTFGLMFFKTKEPNGEKR